MKIIGYFTLILNIKGIPKNLPIVSIKDFIPPEVDKDEHEDEEKMQGM